MAKGQKRSNREVRKPKTKAAPAPASTGKISEVFQVKSGSAKSKPGKFQ